MSEDKVRAQEQARQENNANEQPQTQDQDQNQQSAAVEAGSTGLIANVDTAYKTGDSDEDGNDVYGYAFGGQYFETSEEDADELVASNKAYYAKENDEGNYVVDQERTQARADELAQQKDQEDSEASAEALADTRRYLNSAEGMKGRDAAESNSMPSDAEDLPGRWTEAGSRNREERLHAEAGVSRPV